MVGMENILTSKFIADQPNSQVPKQVLRKSKKFIREID